MNHLKTNRCRDFLFILTMVIFCSPSRAGEPQDVLLPFSNAWKPGTWTELRVQNNPSGSIHVFSGKNKYIVAANRPIHVYPHSTVLTTVIRQHHSPAEKIITLRRFADHDTLALCIGDMHPTIHRILEQCQWNVILPYRQNIPSDARCLKAFDFIIMSDAAALDSEKEYLSLLHWIADGGTLLIPHVNVFRRSPRLYGLLRDETRLLNAASIPQTYDDWIRKLRQDRKISGKINIIETALGNGRILIWPMLNHPTLKWRKKAWRFAAGRYRPRPEKSSGAAERMFAVCRDSAASIHREVNRYAVLYTVFMLLVLMPGLRLKHTRLIRALPVAASLLCLAIILFLIPRSGVTSQLFSVSLPCAQTGQEWSRSTHFLRLETPFSASPVTGTSRLTFQAGEAAAVTQSLDRESISFSHTPSDRPVILRSEKIHRTMLLADLDRSGKSLQLEYKSLYPLNVLSIVIGNDIYSLTQPPTEATIHLAPSLLQTSPNKRKEEILRITDIFRQGDADKNRPILIADIRSPRPWTLDTNGWQTLNRHIVIYQFPKNKNGYFGKPKRNPS